jgi:hypothetical protein
MNVNFALYSHQHSDHYPVKCSDKGYRFLNLFLKNQCEIYHGDFENENFKIKSFPLMHTNKDDSDAGNLAYLIYLKNDDKHIFFATDFYYNEHCHHFYMPMFEYLKDININFYAIECNYNSQYFSYLLGQDDEVAKYVQSTKNHMGSKNFIEFFDNIYKKNTYKPCVLIHTSKRFFYGYKDFLKIGKSITPTIELLEKSYPYVRFAVAKSIY